MNLLIFRPEMGTRSRGQEQTWVKKERMLVVDFPNSVTFAALTQNYKRKNKPVHNKSGSITTVYICNYARKLGYSCKRQMRTVELSDSIIVECNGKECVHNLDNSKREKTDYSKADKVIEDCVKLGVKSRPIKRKLNEENLFEVKVSSTLNFAAKYNDFAANF